MNHTIKPVPQNHTAATFTKILTKEDGHIDWGQSAEFVERHVRAMVPWPGSWTVWQEGGEPLRLTIKKARVNPTPSNDRPGTVLLHQDFLSVVCGERQLLLEFLKPEGKRTMSAKDFANGHQRIVGATFM
jgi:methionyl-tRNA formyltransferase